MAGAGRFGDLRVTGVEMRDFRTYARAQARLGAGLTVVHGPNGAGKSNLLEAIYFGCTGRSPRTRSDRELVRFGASATRVTVDVEDDGREHELSVGYSPPAPGRPAVKRMTCDGAPVERLLDVPVRPLISVFLPDRLELLKGPPAVRRAHLDQFVAALWPLARRDAPRATRACSRSATRCCRGSARAAAGADGRSPPGTASSPRPALALRATARRRSALLAEPFAERAEELGLAGTLTLEYRPQVGGRRTRTSSSPSSQQRLDSDLERGFSGYGPHRDELALAARRARAARLRLAGRAARSPCSPCCSPSAPCWRRERGATPLMLLDDVMSELDAAGASCSPASSRAAGRA